MGSCLRVLRSVWGPRSRGWPGDSREGVLTHSTGEEPPAAPCPPGLSAPVRPARTAQQSPAQPRQPWGNRCFPSAGTRPAKPLTPRGGRSGFRTRFPAVAPCTKQHWDSPRCRVLMWFQLFLAKHRSVWSGFVLFEGVFSVHLQSLLKLRRKTFWFCFLSMLLLIKFHFSSWKRFWFLSAHPECLKYCVETTLLSFGVMNGRLWGAFPPHQARPSNVPMTGSKVTAP